MANTNIADNIFFLCISVLVLWVPQFWHVSVMHSLERLKFHIATIYGCGSQSYSVHDTKSKIEFGVLPKQYLFRRAPHLSPPNFLWLFSRHVTKLSRTFVRESVLYVSIKTAASCDVTSYNLRDDYRRFGRTYHFNVLLNITLNTERSGFAKMSLTVY
jgi:hypothetical protein